MELFRRTSNHSFRQLATGSRVKQEAATAPHFPQLFSLLLLVPWLSFFLLLYALVPSLSHPRLLLPACPSPSEQEWYWGGG